MRKKKVRIKKNYHSVAIFTIVNCFGRDINLQTNYIKIRDFCILWDLWELKLLFYLYSTCAIYKWKETKVYKQRKSIYIVCSSCKLPQVDKVSVWFMFFYCIYSTRPCYFWLDLKHKKMKLTFSHLKFAPYYRWKTVIPN